MEEVDQGNDWVRTPDMPHDDLMDRWSIKFNDLSPSIQREIRNFDNAYEEALRDGFFSTEEIQLLTEKSQKIASRIETELDIIQKKEAEANVGVVMFVVAIVISAIGLRQIIKS